MRTATAQLIVDYIAKNHKVPAKDLIEYLGHTPSAVFRQLAKLLEQGKIKKLGSPPKVFYTLPDKTDLMAKSVAIPNPKIINENFLKISPDGILQMGSEAFSRWCLTRRLDPIKSATEYASILKKYEAFKQDGLIDGLPKLKKTFDSVYLDEMYYLDFYSLEKFGKTKLGEMVLYAKQSQSRNLVKLIVSEIKDKVLKLIKLKKIEAVGYVPPTIKRQVQFMKELESLLNLSLPTIKITKLKTPIIIPQKTLSKLEERVTNARNSIVVEEKKSYKNILLIDDAIGSGSTINETAKQIKQNNLCQNKLIGLGITGSFSGFDVIHEV